MKDLPSPAHECPDATDAMNHAGVETLFRDHAAFVAGFLHRIGTPAADVDDLVQEVFMIAHRKGGYTDGPASPRSWLGAICVRIAANARRARVRRREDYDEAALRTAMAQQRGPEEAVAIRDAMWRVQRALDSLDLDHRAAFVLFEIEGCSCQEIASALEVPVGTVYSRLHAARREFQRAHARMVTKDLVRGVA